MCVKNPLTFTLKISWLAQGNRGCLSINVFKRSSATSIICSKDWKESKCGDLDNSDWHWTCKYSDWHWTCQSNVTPGRLVLLPPLSLNVRFSCLAVPASPGNQGTVSPRTWVSSSYCPAATQPSVRPRSESKVMQPEGPGRPSPVSGAVMSNTKRELKVEPDKRTQS